MAEFETLNLSEFHALSGIESEAEHFEELVAKIIENEHFEKPEMLELAEQVRSGELDIAALKKEIIDEGLKLEEADSGFDVTAYLDIEAKKVADILIKEERLEEAA